MTAEQLILALLTPVSTLAVVMVGFLYNNSRMSDLRGDLKDLMKAELRAVNSEIGRLDAKIDRNHSEMLANHSEMLSRFADLDSRLAHIESHLGMRKA